ncbi:holin-associated N-acetylmuramidase [Defluviimonas sp. WL0002]|uniref:Holin-associated N-acetylmuramidase n=1 Tax=Albidovulum marisflavi TaxID=2984159 RepID=A0ABT2ZH94_9RHOB|nr:holin-associated N-acetylmuramidase [Defluviimonas sp. WL0002]MCV2870492.1 holin-associated N-acetylmuramidase [Defluviimonas sp. WL0002]
MPSVEEIAREITAREGGYVNDPDDPGGATNHGVTLGAMRRLGIDLDGDGRVTTSDVKQLTRARAEQIFVEQYFRKPRIDLLPQVVQASVFDMYVNAGAEAVRILQLLLNDMGFEVTVDAAIGPQTSAAAVAAADPSPGLLADAYGIARRDYYYALGDRRPASRKFARRRDGGKGGWILRAEEFISPRFHLSETEHRERTASWA